MNQQVVDGTLVVEGKNDILAMALGTPEHGVRVWGAGQNFTPTNFFDLPKCVSKSTKLEAENKMLKERIRKYESIFAEKGILVSSMEEYMASNSARSDNEKRKDSFFDELLSGKYNKKSSPSNDAAFEATSNSAATRESALSKLQLMEKVVHKATPTLPPSQPQGKVVQKVTFTMPPLKPQSCSLAIDSKDNIVAKGTFYPKMGPNETIHNVSLGEDNVRVVILLAIQGDALLPIPVTDEYIAVDSTLAVFVAWPKKWVTLETEIAELSNVAIDGDKAEGFNNYVYKDMNDKLGGDIDEKTFKDFACELQAQDEIVQLLVPLERGVFEHEMQHYIVKEDVLDVCRFNMLTADSVVLYIRLMGSSY